MLQLELSELKTYLRIDGDEEDSFLVLLIEGAKEYLSNAGVVESDEKLYKLAVMMYVMAQYERFDDASGLNKLKDALTSIILQLKVGV